jgi:pilus assembly protein CpaD
MFAMVHSIRHLCTGAAALALIVAGTAAESKSKPLNRGVETVHQPVVTRTDFVLDVATTPSGLAPGEAERLAGWFDGLNLGYGDTITLDVNSGWRATPARDAVSAIVADYGILVSHDPAPITAGHPNPGTLRVVVSHASAHVDGCPDWSHSADIEVAGANPSDFGCANSSFMAAMVANPQDLIQGRSSGAGSDARTSVKAIKAYRDAAVTGAGGTAVKQESSKAGGN